MQTYQTYFKREFDKKRENSGVLARFVLFLAGIKYCCPNRARKRGECDGMSQYLSKRVDDAVLQIVRQALEKIKGSAKDEAVKTQYEKKSRLKTVPLA